MLAVDVALQVVDCGLNSAVWAPDRGVGSLRHYVIGKHYDLLRLYAFAFKLLG